MALPAIIVSSAPLSSPDSSLSADMVSGSPGLPVVSAAPKSPGISSGAAPSSAFSPKFSCVPTSAAYVSVRASISFRFSSLAISSSISFTTLDTGCGCFFPSGRISRAMRTAVSFPPVWFGDSVFSDGRATSLPAADAVWPAFCISCSCRIFSIGGRIASSQIVV